MLIMKRTYYIVEHVDGLGHKFWSVHKRGILSTFNVYNQRNYIKGTRSYKSQEECRQRLLSMNISSKGKVTRTLRI